MFYMTPTKDTYKVKQQQNTHVDHLNKSCDRCTCQKNI